MNTSNLNKLLVIGEKKGLCLFMSYSLQNEILQTGRKERRVDVHPGLGENLNRYSDPTGVYHERIRNLFTSSFAEVVNSLKVHSHEQNKFHS